MANIWDPRKSGEERVLAVGLAVLDTSSGGKGSGAAKGVKVIELNGSINIIKSRLQHVIDRHTISGINNINASTFNKGEDIVKLIKSGTQQSVILGDRGTKYYRIYDVGRNISIDRSTGQQTSMISIITKTNGDLVTAFPGSAPIFK